MFSLSLSVHQRAQEEVHSKELKVKLLTDSVNSFIGKAPPTSHDALRSELEVLTANYQRLCSRLDGKCKTLEVQFDICPSLTLKVQKLEEMLPNFPPNFLPNFFPITSSLLPLLPIFFPSSWLSKLTLERRIRSVNVPHCV